LRWFDDERSRAIEEEIAKLLDAGFIKEFLHLGWLANPILVPKKNNKWRMCVDYTSLNKECPKDPYLLPYIDQIIDSTARSELLCFHDAYSGYHQIRMKESDQLATSFITLIGAYCYVTMPFGLKNAGATYQHCMKCCLHEQISRNAKAYVDDIVVKSSKARNLIQDLLKTFESLQKFKIKLNLEKCTFGVPSDKLLSYIVSAHKIETNPMKVKAILGMGPPRALRHAQKLMGCLASLSQLISRLGEKGLPLYKLLCKMLD
jgi:hypothetical protein